MTAPQDIPLALRLLRQTPALSGIALLSIALSVAGPAVVFTAVKAVLIDPLPYRRAGELVQIRTEFAGAGPSQGDWVFWRDTQEIVRRNRSFESTGIYGNAIFDLAGDPSAPPEALYGLRVSASLFPALGVSPMLGRNILPEEDRPGHGNEMILSYGLWTRRFNSDRAVIGRTVKINGRDCAVIGVMPPQFNFPLRRVAAHTPSPYVEFWAPLQIDPASTGGGLGAVARLRPGVSLAQAQQDLASIGAALGREFPATNRGVTFRLGFLRDRTVGKAASALWFLQGASVMFLLIGCANVSNLLLARGLARQRELAIRMAIGAGRAAIIRQSLTESLVLAAIGALGGYLLTLAAWKILPALAPVSIPRLAAARADWTILAFALLAAPICGVVFGLAPALRAASTRALAARGFSVRGVAGKDRLRASLVAAEVAVSFALVVIGGQLLGSFIGLLRADPGFPADRILASVVLPARERYPRPEQRAALYRRFLEAVRALPGVQSAGTVDALPFSGENHGGFVSATQAVVMDPNAQLIAEIDVVSPEYLRTMGVRLIEGRWFHSDETKESSGAAIVNAATAARLWPGSTAIGKRICVFCTPESPNNWKQVVGVVSGIRHAALEGPTPASVYLAAGAFENAAFLVVRTGRPTADLERAIRRAIAAIDPNQPVFLSATMGSLIADSIADRRFVMTLLAVTGCLALLMAAAGVYGVTSYTTSRRTQEIGVRMALGATPGKVQALVFRQGFLTAAWGLAIGLGLALTLLRALRGALAGIDSGTPSRIWIAAGLVALSAAAACWIPARRAAGVDPMCALRDDR